MSSIPGDTAKPSTPLPQSRGIPGMTKNCSTEDIARSDTGATANLTPISVSDLAGTEDERAMSSLIENLEHKMIGISAEEEASKAILKGIPENVISTMLHYENEQKEMHSSRDSSQKDHDNSRNSSGSFHNFLTIAQAAASEAHNKSIVTVDGTTTTTAAASQLTAPSVSPSVPKPRRKRVTTGSSSGSNKDSSSPRNRLNTTDRCTSIGSNTKDAPRSRFNTADLVIGIAPPSSSSSDKPSKDLWAKVIKKAQTNENTSSLHNRESSGGYGSNLAFLADCLTKEQTRATRPKLETFGTKRSVMDKNGVNRCDSVDVIPKKDSDKTGRYMGFDTKEDSAGEPPESNASLLYKNAALLFLRKGTSADPSSSTVQSNMEERPPETELRQRTAVQRWANLRASVALAQTTTEKPKDIQEQDLEGGGDPKVDFSNTSDKLDDVGKQDEDNMEEDDFDPSLGGNRRANPMQKRWLLFKYRITSLFLVHKDRKKFFLALRLLGSLAILLIGIASILFYACGNPLTYSETGGGASFSWWLILTFRWACTLFLAKVIEFLFVDIFAMRSNFALKLFGPFLTLVLVQSKGWSFQLMCWGLCNLALLHGRIPFANHWLYWQPYISMFNADNPSGVVLSEPKYLSVLIACIVIGFLSALKKTGVAVWLGQKTCEYYGPQLEKLMKDMILMSAVANLSREIEESADAHTRLSDHHDPAIWEKTALRYKLKLKSGEDGSAVSGDDGEIDDLDDLSSQATEHDEEVEYDSSNITGSKVELLSAKITSRPSIRKSPSPSGSPGNRSSGKLKIYRLLDSWEEPNNIADEQHNRPAVSIQDVLQFRRIMSHLDVTYPFSKAFGLADNRNSCAISAQEVYSRLLRHTPDELLLPFETLGILARDENGEVSEEKTKPLLRLFPPDGEKKLTMLDFVKSYDEIYRKFRTFRAAVSNSSVLNNAYEKIVDVVFYFAMVLLVLIILKVDVLTTITTVMSLVLSFSFAFGPAVSKFTQGVLLVTLQKPYDIGDRIHISQSTAETAADGTAMWFVENISLFFTTLRFASTNEVATISNGDLSNTKIINGARSVNACVCVRVKFGIYTAYDLIEHFKSSVEDFVKARPREWARLNAIRASNVQADLGFIEYTVALQHREAWQNVGAILTSKAELASFCLELSKKLGMKYIQSPLPVHLELGGQNNIQEALAAMGSDSKDSAATTSPATGDRTTLDRGSDLKSSAQAVAGLFKKPLQK